MSVLTLPTFSSPSVAMHVCVPLSAEVSIISEIEGDVPFTKLFEAVEDHKYVTVPAACWAEHKRVTSVPGW